MFLSHLWMVCARTCNQWKSWLANLLLCPCRTLDNNNKASLCRRESFQEGNLRTWNRFLKCNGPKWYSGILYDRTWYKKENGKSLAIKWLNVVSLSLEVNSKLDKYLPWKNIAWTTSWYTSSSVLYYSKINANKSESLNRLSEIKFKLSLSNGYLRSSREAAQGHVTCPPNHGGQAVSDGKGRGWNSSDLCFFEKKVLARGGEDSIRVILSL